jgi:hypothetical protein
LNETDAKSYRLLAELIAAEAELNEAYTPAARRRCLKRYEEALDRYSDLALRPVADVAASKLTAPTKRPPGDP